MRNLRPLPLLVLLITAVIAGCSDSVDPTEPLEIPAAYPATDFAANTAVEREIYADYAALVSAMAAGNTGANVSGDQLVVLLSELAPSTTTFFATVAPMYAEQLDLASGGTYDPRQLPAQNGEGGVYENRLFDETGLEVKEVIEKGLFAALMYNHAATILSKSSVTAADIDRVVAIYGATPAFRNSDQSEDQADQYCAKYAARRDKNDGAGPYTSFRDAAKKARAAASAGPAYQNELTDGISGMRRHWERSQMGTVINYLYAASQKWSVTSPTNADIASGMHAYGEAIGFLMGWKGIPANSKIITDAKIDELLGLLRVSTTSPSSCYQFWQNPASTLGDLQTVMSQLQIIYGFSDAEMIDFRTNWVSAQGRR